MKILIIDDEIMVLSALEEFLTKYGHTVEVAEDGEAGISKFDNGKFDLVITDMVMPGIEGDEVLEHIRSSNQKFIPVIGMSGTPWFLEGKDFDTVLKKPFSIQSLLKIIDKVSQIFSQKVANTK